MPTHKKRHQKGSLLRESLKTRLCQRLTIMVVGLLWIAGNAQAETLAKRSPKNQKQVVGPTAMVEEAESRFSFPARVDTGATTSSLHVEDCQVKDKSNHMKKNVGKTIRFRIKNQNGKSEWLERRIAEISVIKTSEREERRYKVPITLRCQDVKKRVLVSLNDRSHMKYPMLLGRNFLQDDFIVDVSLDEEKRSSPSKKNHSKENMSLENMSLKNGTQTRKK